MILILISSCKSSVEEKDLIDMTMPNVNINEKNNEVKNQIEIRFSCGEDNISKYIDDGWNIVKKSTKEKICTWKSFPASKNCNMEKDKGCKITKPDKIGEETIYLLES